MSHVRESVGTSKQGSTKALAGSGISSMSLSLMAWKPRIDEPSNPKPSVNVSSASSFNGIEKCCQVPGRSVNRTSTICRPASFARRITSAGDVPVAAFPPVTVGSNVAVLARALLPESVRRFARGGPYGKLEGLREGVKKSVHKLHEKSLEGVFALWNCANCPTECAAGPLQRFHEVYQFDRRKLPEPLLNILLLPFEEDPSRHLVELAIHEVNAPAHRAQRRVGLALQIDVPALLAALQLSHVLAVLGTRHGPLLYRLSSAPPARSPALHCPPNDMSCLRCTTLLYRPLLPQVRGRRRCHRSHWVARRFPVGARRRCARRARYGRGDAGRGSGSWESGAGSRAH